MPGPDPVISPADAKDALLRSGYLLESRVEAVLRHAHYYVQANASYQDPLTGKSREYDLYVMTAEKVGPGESDYLFPVLLIECVNNPQPLALLTKEPMAAFLHRDEVKLSGLPVKFPDPKNVESWLGMAELFEFEKFHHYCTGRIATQYCTFQKKKDGQWMAWHDEEHFDAFKKLCDALDYSQRSHFAAWHFKGPEPLNVEMYYPLVVLQGELWDARATTKGVTLKRAPHLQFRRSVATATKEYDYQIDVIEERFLGQYIDMIEEETAKVAQLLRGRPEAVRQAIDKIAEAAKAATTDASKRAAMEL